MIQTKLEECGFAIFKTLVASSPSRRRRRRRPLKGLFSSVAAIRGKIGAIQEQAYSMGQLFKFVSLSWLNVPDELISALGYEQRKHTSEPLFFQQSSESNPPRETSCCNVPRKQRTLSRKTSSLLSGRLT